MDLNSRISCYCLYKSQQKLFSCCKYFRRLLRNANYAKICTMLKCLRSQYTSRAVRVPTAHRKRDNGEKRPYYIMRCFTGVLDFSRVYDTNMLVSKTRVKTQEKCKKKPKREPNARKCFYITLGVGQKRESVAFCSCFAHKPYQNANPTHSVIWALGYRIL